MGKKKLESIEKIENKNSRNVTYCKRKRGLIKKAIELSKLCDQYVYLVVFDVEKQRLIEYNSSADFNAQIMPKLTSPSCTQHFKYERYDNGHYGYFEKNSGGLDTAPDKDFGLPPSLQPKVTLPTTTKMLNTKWTPQDIARMIQEENDDDEAETDQLQPDFVKKFTNPENRRQNKDEDESDKDEEQVTQIKNSGKRPLMESVEQKQLNVSIKNSLIDFNTQQNEPPINKIQKIEEKFEHKQSQLESVVKIMPPLITEQIQQQAQLVQTPNDQQKQQSRIFRRDSMLSPKSEKKPGNTKCEIYVKSSSTVSHKELSAPTQIAPAELVSKVSQLDETSNNITEQLKFAGTKVAGNSPNLLPRLLNGNQGNIPQLGSYQELLKMSNKQNQPINTNILGQGLTGNFQLANRHIPMQNFSSNAGNLKSPSTMSAQLNQIQQQAQPPTLSIYDPDAMAKLGVSEIFGKTDQLLSQFNKNQQSNAIYSPIAPLSTNLKQRFGNPGVDMQSAASFSASSYSDLLKMNQGINQTSVNEHVQQQRFPSMVNVEQLTSQNQSQRQLLQQNQQLQQMQNLSKNIDQQNVNVQLQQLNPQSFSAAIANLNSSKKQSLMIPKAQNN